MCPFGCLVRFSMKRADFENQPNFEHIFLKELFEHVCPNCQVLFGFDRLYMFLYVFTSCPVLPISAQT